MTTPLARLSLALTAGSILAGCDVPEPKVAATPTPTPTPVAASPTPKPGAWMWDPKRKSPLDKPPSH